MAVISTDRPVMTLINTFEVEPGKADELVRVLAEATDEVMCKLPGFVSANLHKSEDGKRVVNYAQWESRSDFQAMLKNPQAQPHMKAAAEIAESFEPVIYEVAYSD